MKLLKRTWANIDLDCLHHNYTEIKNRISSGTMILGVMKADAYGHGAVPMSHAMVDMGVNFLAVSNIEEAVQIHRGEVHRPILVLGYTPPSYAEMMVFMDIRQEVHSLAYARELNEALHNTNYTLQVHVKLDTGMTRIGFFTEDMDRLSADLEELSKLEHLHVEGAFTHFSAADSLAPEDVSYTREQYRHFLRGLELMESLGITVELRHCCNSGATVLHREYSMDMIRPGILLYGVHPSADTVSQISLKPVMSLQSMIAQIRSVKKGSAVSYGRTYTAQRDFLMGVIPIGYADGLSRSLSGQGELLVLGKRVPIVGRICMDMCMVDLSEVPDAVVGDRVTVFGDGLPCTEVADKVGTIPYEILCGINKRIPRIFYRRGEVSEILQYIV